MSVLREMKDARAAERFAVNAGTSCPFAGPVREDFGAARITSVSMHGAGLLLGRPVEVGALLAVRLVNPAKGFDRTVLIRITHAAPEGGGWAVGGAFLTPLTYQEMTSLVL